MLVLIAEQFIIETDISTLDTEDIQSEPEEMKLVQDSAADAGRPLGITEPLLYDISHTQVEVIMNDF